MRETFPEPRKILKLFDELTDDGRRCGHPVRLFAEGEFIRSQLSFGFAASIWRDYAGKRRTAISLRPGWNPGDDCQAANFDGRIRVLPCTLEDAHTSVLSQ